jgi:hypothetical protein
MQVLLLMPEPPAELKQSYKPAACWQFCRLPHCSHGSCLLPHPCTLKLQLFILRLQLGLQEVQQLLPPQAGCHGLVSQQLHTCTQQRRAKRSAKGLHVCGGL